MKRTLTLAAALLLLCFMLASACAAPILLRAGTIEPGAKSGFRLDAKAPKSGHYIIQFVGPVEDAWKQEVEGLGVKLGSYIPENGFVARMSPEQVRQVIGLKSVTWIERIKPEYRKHPSLKSLSAGDVRVMVKIYPEESPSVVEAFVKSVGGAMLEPVKGTDRYLAISIPSGALDGLAALESVAWIEEWVQPRPSNNVATGIIGAHDVRQRIGLYGEGQILAFADSGLDTGNLATLCDDFAGRILAAYALRRPDDWSDVTGHGTHAIGVAVNSGVLSGSDPAQHSYDSSFAGVAPEAQIVIQSIGDSSGFVYPPLTLSTLFQPTYDLGARVHSDSWGSPVQGRYTFYSEQVDEFVNSHRDFVLVFPMGNDGKDTSNGGDGVTDMNMAYAPATAKNCISVGATENVRSDGWNTTYGSAWPLDFPKAPLRNDHVSDNAQGMASWSCRGPCEDGRIKPDICAPGTNIVSTRSHGATNVTGWKVYDPNYIFWGGTSMSTPMVAGSAVLVREYYVKNRGIDPSAALVKATLLNGATDLSPGQHTLPMEVPPRPNSVQGWGRVNLSASLDPPAPRVLDSVDEGEGLSLGQVRTYQYNVLGSSVPLAVTLVWTDPPGDPMANKQLVNDLDLKVQTPGGQLLRGNGTTDDKNNVESVDIPSPAPGVYTVTVTGRVVPQGPQTFALVVSGELPGGYIAGTVRTISGHPISGVLMTFADGGVTRTTMTGQNGEYSLHVPTDSYIIIPSKEGWTFNPQNWIVPVIDVGVRNIDFTGSAAAGRITGTVTRAVGGHTNYVLESDHPYAENTDVTYTITAHPSATRIRVHFDEVELQNGYDYVYIEDADGNMVDALTGIHSDKWSAWVNGNVAKVHLVSDQSMTYYGFHVDGYETDVITQGPMAGVTVRAEPGGAAGITQADGTYAIEGLEPIAYTLTPELPHWSFSPARLPVTVQPGETSSSQSFQAFPPGTISGVVSAGTSQEYAYPYESEHPYPDLTVTVETITHTGASRMRVHFTDIEMEPGFDFVEILDTADNIIDTFTGTYSDVWSSWVTGDTLKVRMQSDEGFSLYGFSVDKYAAVSGEHGVPGVTVTAQPSGLSAVTDASGVYTIVNVDAGQAFVTAQKPYWSFAPASRTANVAAGVNTLGVDFYGTVSPMPDIAYIKTLQDGSDVSLSGKVVTAGTDMLPGCFYIEESGRHAGIRVNTTRTIQAGSIVTVSGIMGTLACERCVQASEVTVAPDAGQIPDPIGLNCRELGGAWLNQYSPGVKFGVGLNNLGLLTRIWGRVANPETGVFYVIDGSISESETGQPGVKVLLCGSLTPPQADTLVQVTGISSCEQVGSDCIRVLRIREAADVKPQMP